VSQAEGRGGKPGVLTPVPSRRSFVRISGRLADVEVAKRAVDRLIPLTVPEVRRLLLRLVWDRLTPAGQALACSEWRRRHQQRARECHYRIRRARPPN